jgi:5'-deoxynucleotidase YfbR-like HD superfamily hydrolase
VSRVLSVNDPQATAPMNVDEMPMSTSESSDVPLEEVERDIEVIIWSMKLATVRRYFHQRFWEKETVESEFASKVEPDPRLENVAEHSWHVADTVLVLGPRFPDIDLGRAVMLAVLHDKMEISIGDYNPVGRDGTGKRTHAFNASAKARKIEAERRAVSTYLGRLNAEASHVQEPLFNELLEEESNEARFVKSVDKLQALAYVLVKKSGKMSDSHIAFTMKYSDKVKVWPPLSLHLDRLRERLFASIARCRDVEVDFVRDLAYRGQQATLFDM